MKTKHLGITGHSVAMLGIMGAVASSLDRHTRVVITGDSRLTARDQDLADVKRGIEDNEREGFSGSIADPELSRQARRAKDRARAKGTPIRNRNGTWEYMK